MWCEKEMVDAAAYEFAEVKSSVNADLYFIKPFSSHSKLVKALFTTVTRVNKTLPVLNILKGVTLCGA